MLDDIFDFVVSESDGSVSYSHNMWLLIWLIIFAIVLIY